MLVRNAGCEVIRKPRGQEDVIENRLGIMDGKFFNVAVLFNTAMIALDTPVDGLQVAKVLVVRGLKFV